MAPVGPSCRQQVEPGLVQPEQGTVLSDQYGINKNNHLSESERYTRHPL
jgi:hypothetical protein